MVKLTLSMFIGALVAAPTFAYGSPIQRRSASEDSLFGRELSNDQTLLLARCPPPPKHWYYSPKLAHLITPSNPLAGYSSVADAMCGGNIY
ncbi:hypothetical protein BYT27DRAFT_7337027 [Phlegmacium glaucopus]|nr:hypothetical protein BYT27DRAFT_7337027 [Phlegmacium glaucopus]